MCKPVDISFFEGLCPGVDIPGANSPYPRPNVCITKPSWVNVGNSDPPVWEKAVMRTSRGKCGIEECSVFHTISELMAWIDSHPKCPTQAPTAPPDPTYKPTTAPTRDIRIDPGGCKAVGFNLGTSRNCASKTTRESCCQTIISSTGPCESGGCKWEEAKITTYACYYTGPGPKACVWGPPSFPQFPPACTSDSDCTLCCPVTPPLTNKCISLTDPIECHKLTEEQCNGDCTYGPSSGVSMPKTLAPTFGLVITG